MTKPAISCSHRRLLAPRRVLIPAVLHHRFHEEEIISRRVRRESKQNECLFHTSRSNPGNGNTKELEGLVWPNMGVLTPACSKYRVLSIMTNLQTRGYEHNTLRGILGPPQITCPYLFAVGVAPFAFRCSDKQMHSSVSHCAGTSASHTGLTRMNRSVGSGG